MNTNAYNGGKMDCWKSPNDDHYFGMRVVIAMVILAVILIIVGAMRNVKAGQAPVYPADQQAPASDKSLDSPQLESARRAQQGGNYYVAMHEYAASLRQEPWSAQAAARELADLCLERAASYRESGNPARESGIVNWCLRVLTDVRNNAGNNDGDLAAEAIREIHTQIERVRRVGKKQCREHILRADKLRRKAKGFWDDDEKMQMEALHYVNLAWSYLEIVDEDWMVKKMWEIHHDMKDELLEWRYKHVMERDRILLGGVIDHKQEAPAKR